MSTLAYAAFTAAREKAPPRTSTSDSPPGVKTYVDVLAALVPAEVLTAHGVILAFTTSKDASGKASIDNPHTLSASFYGLVLLCILLYWVARRRKLPWVPLDYARMLIPPAAFVGWTMLQRATAFDAVAPNLSYPARSVIAVFLAVLLGIAASVLAVQADRSAPAPTGVLPGRVPREVAPVGSGVTGG
jgi:hypothetical protein